MTFIHIVGTVGAHRTATSEVAARSSSAVARPLHVRSELLLLISIVLLVHLQSQVQFLENLTNLTNQMKLLSSHGREARLTAQMNLRSSRRLESVEGRLLVGRELVRQSHRRLLIHGWVVAEAGRRLGHQRRGRQLLHLLRIKRSSDHADRRQ